MLAKLIVIIIHNMHKSNHAVHLQLIQCVCQLYTKTGKEKTFLSNKFL